MLPWLLCFKIPDFDNSNNHSFNSKYLWGVSSVSDPLLCAGDKGVGETESLLLSVFREFDNICA